MMSGLMQSAANLIQQVTTSTGGFAMAITYTDGTVTKVCNSVIILHGLFINESGMATVQETSRIMVSEAALEAVGYPTRDTNHRLTLKDNKVTFTDPTTSVSVTFIIRMAIKNDFTKMISCTLGETS